MFYACAVILGVTENLKKIIIFLKTNKTLYADWEACSAVCRNLSDQQHNTHSTMQRHNVNTYDRVWRLQGVRSLETSGSYSTWSNKSAKQKYYSS